MSFHKHSFFFLGYFNRLSHLYLPVYPYLASATTLTSIILNEQYMAENEEAENAVVRSFFSIPDCFLTKLFGSVHQPTHQLIREIQSVRKTSFVEFSTCPVTERSKNKCLLVGFASWKDPKAIPHTEISLLPVPAAEMKRRHILF
ncbi:hypothetical protein DFH09DRAFT_1371755 [Mycena vulgaris]|nr:hypothetical protein DFH09DRAFT_1371755 [Mycena vulgaris]